MATPPEHSSIEDYAAIGDGHTVALVARNGSLDWLCLPRFDAPACFSRILGDPDGSHWLLGVRQDGVTARRRYVGDTNVLETTYAGPEGEVRITDFMPTGDHRHDVVRRVEGVRGRLEVRHELVIRFD